MFPFIPVLLRMFGGSLLSKVFSGNTLSSIGSFVKNNKKLVLVGILSIAVCFGIWTVKSKFDNLHTELTEKESVIQIMQISLAEFETATEAQNRSIAEYKAKGEAAAKLAKKKAQEAAAREKQHRKELDALMVEKVPEQCEAAMDWMVEKADGDLKW